MKKAFSSQASEFASEFLNPCGIMLLATGRLEPNDQWTLLGMELYRRVDAFVVWLYDLCLSLHPNICDFVFSLKDPTFISSCFENEDRSPVVIPVR